MKRLWKRGDLDLDSEHREARPDAPDELEGPVGKRAAPASRRRMTWVALAAAVTVLALVPVAVVGGFGELAGAAKGVAANQKPNKDQKQQPPPPKEKQYAPNQVTICHLPGTADEQTMTVPKSAVKLHMRHGDTTGACPTA